MSEARGVSIEGLANQFKAVFQSLEPDVRYATDKKILYARVVQQVVSRNRQPIPDDYGTRLVSGLAEIYGDSLQFRAVVEAAIVFCVKDIYSPYSGYGQYTSREYIAKQVARVISEYY